jgi:hypothetical protein
MCSARSSRPIADRSSLSVCISPATVRTPRTRRRRRLSPCFVVWRSSGGDAQLSTWIYRIAIRTAIRIKARHRPHDEIAEVETLDRSTGIEEQAIEQERMRILERALTRLPLEQRRTAAKYWWDLGFTSGGHFEISRDTGRKPPHQARTRCEFSIRKPARCAGNTRVYGPRFVTEGMAGQGHQAHGRIRTLRRLGSSSSLRGSACG